MRYSKARKIVVACVSTFCLLLTVFIIYNGIEYSRKISNDSDEKYAKKILANTIQNKEKTNKNNNEIKENAVDDKKISDENKDEIKNKETKVDSQNDYNVNMIGNYSVKSLKVNNKSYSTEELKKLKNAGYSLSLELKDGGLAYVSVLSINRLYEFTYEYFNDGTNKYKYTYKKNKLNITIDNYEIVFERE